LWLGEITIRQRQATEHEAAKKAVRDHQKLIDRHRAELAEQTRELNRANDARAQTIAARDAVQQERRQLSRFAERREIERLNLLLTGREAEAEYATQQAGQIQARINNMNLVELKPLMEKLSELVAEEARLNHFVSGRGYTNELGIVIPSRPPL
jgi:superfamily I DNA and/or RNA helicase